MRERLIKLIRTLMIVVDSSYRPGVVVTYKYQSSQLFSTVSLTLLVYSFRLSL